MPAGEINADLAPLLLLVRRVRDVNLEFARSPLFGNATGPAQEILQAEEQLRILEKNVHAAMRSPEWPQRGRFSQFQQRVCNVKLLPGRTPSKTKALATQKQLGWLPPEQPSDDGAEELAPVRQHLPPSRPPREGGWGRDLPRFHVRENVSRADERLAAQIADAPAPFWSQVRDALAERHP